MTTSVIDILVGGHRQDLTERTPPFRDHCVLLTKQRNYGHWYQTPFPELSPYPMTDLAGRLTKLCAVKLLGLALLFLVDKRISGHRLLFAFSLLHTIPLLSVGNNTST